MSEWLLWVCKVFGSVLLSSLVGHLRTQTHITGMVFVITKVESVTVYQLGQVLIVLNVACPVLWIVLVIETPPEVVV